MNGKDFWHYFSLKKGTLDNDYYFYDDGRILHHYDRIMKKTDIEEYVGASDISERDKQAIMEECPLEFKEKVYNMLYPED